VCLAGPSVPAPRGEDLRAVHGVLREALAGAAA